MQAARDAFQPNYHFASQALAEKERAYRAKSFGHSTAMLVVLGNGKGKFALVPVHLAHQFGGEEVKRTFKDKQRVRDVCQVAKVGTVVKAGPEVCEVQWDRKEKGHTDFVPNYYLEDGPEPAEKPKRERVRLIERVRLVR